MDMIKIGNFLSELRREKGLTQEQLGNELGVSNKTVSRWETGTYLPPVEILQMLSAEYDVSINEILSGERIENAEEFKLKAENNIVTALDNSAFSLKDKQKFWSKKWLKDHAFELIAEIAVLIALSVVGALFFDPLTYAIPGFCFAWVLFTNNRKTAYVESKLYDDLLTRLKKENEEK